MFPSSNSEFQIRDFESKKWSEAKSNDLLWESEPHLTLAVISASSENDSGQLCGSSERGVDKIEPNGFGWSPEVLVVMLGLTISHPNTRTTK